MIRQTIVHTKAATFCVELPDKANQDMPTPMGTGFFVSPDGWFVTAAHVVTENNEHDGPVRNDIDQVWLTQETRVAERKHGAMCQFVSFGHILPEFDIALLKVDFRANAKKEWLQPLSEFPNLTVSSRELDEGEPVYGFGYPLSIATARPVLPGIVLGSSALCPRVTSAIVSSTLECSGMFMTAADAKVYVLDKALNYGNSGGPIVSVQTGHVHAICTKFQPLPIEQSHLKDPAGNTPFIMIPSLYGLASSLSNQSVLSLLISLGVPVVDA